MGHLLSKNGNRGNRLKKRKRKVLKRKKRNCFLQGPCMLCFIVHGNGGSLANGSGAGEGDDKQVGSEVVSSSGSERLAALSSPDDCAKFLLSPRELAIWEGLSGVRGRLVLPRALFRATPACEYAEMVCKRKCADMRRCAPCKQPRCCAVQEVMENGGGAGGGTGGGSKDTTATTAHRPLPVCPLPSSSSSSSSSSEGVSGAEPLTELVEIPGSTDSTAATTPPQSSSPPCPEDHSHADAHSGENPADCSSINQLPSSILLKVFSHLSVKERCLSVSLVCKYWRDLCLDFQFWKQIDLSGLQQVTDELLVKIASWKLNVTEVNLSDCRNVQDQGVCVLASHCPGLLKYTAYRCKQLSDVSLVAVASHCPLLQKVHVGNQDKLTDEALKKLGQCCAELRDIHLGQCYNISDVGMEALAQGCPKLQRIYMQENKLVTDRSVRAFAEHCPDLQFVGFMGCSVTSLGVIHLSRLKNLNSLDLRHISELNNETVMEVVRQCRSLSSLNLCLNWSINDRCVEIIAKEGRSLKELYLVSCKITDYALIAIGKFSSTIETVDAGWCKEITDQGATQIAKSSKSLRYLGLMRCDKVNEDTVERLVQQYPHIVFSTVMQDCKRTLERAYQMGWNPNNSAAS